MDLTIFRKLRKQQGLTLIELSRTTGVRRETLSLIERGLANPRKNTTETIATALNAKIMVLEDKYKYLKVVKE